MTAWFSENGCRFPENVTFIAFYSIFWNKNLIPEFRSWNEPKRKNENNILKKYRVGFVTKIHENGLFVNVEMDLCRTKKHQTKINRKCSLILDRAFATINHDCIRIPTVKLKIPGKHFWNPNPKLLLHSSYSFWPCFHIFFMVVDLISPNRCHW